MSAITPDRLTAIRERDRTARIYRDRFGGEWMKRCDILAAGAQACIDRRELLAEFDRRDSGKALGVPHA